MKEHKIKLSILKILSDGCFHSGEALGDQLGVSRAAISKHIQGIQKWGVDIFRVQGKGYQLAHSFQLLDEKAICRLVSTPVELVPIIDSTNQYLIDRGESLQSGAACVAEYQSKGRGRRGREWVSPFGSNLYLSMFWRLEAGMAAAMGLSLVVGVAIVEALSDFGIKGIKLKWPNDLYYQDRKLAGILVELSGQAGGAANLVIGMGMNLNMPHIMGDIDQPWSSLAQVTNGEEMDRNQLAAAMIRTLNKAMLAYEVDGMVGLVERWNCLDNYIDRPVKLMLGSKTISGIAKGINDQGAILLETGNGIESYIGGEISLRGND
ncbi:bifunctional biotin--[acetyl-CoA-carboxylase] ligase/biotin operon repressor BirA [Vibrio ostreicida]|uniref:Bifunctional ligase/repressor BirA n=1 Tax=Vibrio ostreicida TaxID=526588 RepID=A0ABT8BQ47_9VIBR|nr:bifunctional biotin--[acetyl-CoA-carboxylase] ligase/biotin operon repressor BirA [Vibrio ostreicida]MDN3608459.1 bifunctional biotin--[acetyl-CoA-carboxylase] ligase/biotin operon repressor BirA [Vibrio ostreicida]MDN3611227.1 bifunctional biotin--[acetyl-CoA-carboxylase] ligase/biotin operon repressor BirA [Vibrio ostreicida]NPD10281.1 bifunctional biotin--[acetyl-CoA-carboxylase] ligase/biotin operon repressor BirA [Vibrio ostreicida]